MSRGKVWVVMGYYANYDDNEAWLDSVWTAKKHAESRAFDLKNDLKRHQLGTTDFEVEPVMLNRPDGRV